MKLAEPLTLALWLAVATPLTAQSTRPERTGYRETSSYDDVRGFLDSLQTMNRGLRTGTLGISSEGRRIPYVVAARPGVLTPVEAHRSGKPVIYLQADIHGGEVEGKEAAQMLLRDLAAGPLGNLLDKIILLVVPIYNPDGNERWAPGERNRPGQNGPAIVGLNTNGGGLNLNRDYVKLEAPETRGSVRLLQAWDPDLFIDLHTTNGSYHGYVLTYAPGLNPNISPAVKYVRDRFLPEVQRRMQQRHRQRTFSYGNFRSQHRDSLVLGWETYDARPRFGTNWMGLRGRASILSEGYSNADFQTRITATYNFVREVLTLAAEQAGQLTSISAESNRSRPDSIAVRSVLAQPTSQAVIAEITEDAGAGSDGYARRRRTGVYRSIRMPVYDRFVPSRKEKRAGGYLIPARLKQVVELLERQGISVESITGRLRTRAEVFNVATLVVDSLFEGHHPVRAEGQWLPQQVDTTVAAGWYLVSTDQPLGTLAAYLLEPASEDGVVTWNFLDQELHAGSAYPILRVEETAIPSALAP